jgi:predicted glutamine amidotransferase
MCQRSTSLEGDWQGDGWGIAWQQTQGEWQLHRSVAPIWTEMAVLEQLPQTPHVLVHARSASFAEHKDNVTYNQPYVHGAYAFVFNGLVQGVRLPWRVPGTIGAQKIWYLIRHYMRQGDTPPQALAQVYTLIEQHSREIRACKLGVSNGQEYWVWNGNPTGLAYYRLHHAQTDTLRMVSSEPFGEWAWHSA